MYVQIRSVAVCAACLWAHTALGAVVVFNGDLTAGDPTFNRPTSVSVLSSVGTAVAYDTYAFVADAVGPYSVNGDYAAGGLGSNLGLDGYLLLYSPSFNPASPLTNLVAADDDNDADGGGPLTAFDGSLIPSTASYGPGTTASVLTLNPGQSYTVVVAAFDNATVATGLGPYTLTITGVVPEPSMLIGLSLAGCAMACYRRR